MTAIIKHCYICDAEVEVDVCTDVYLCPDTHISHPYLQMYKCKMYNHFVEITEAGRLDWNRWVVQQLKKIREKK